MYSLNLLISTLLFSSLSFAAPLEQSLPANVVKVTKENNPNCVEYYTYKGQMYCSLMTVDNKSMDPQLLSYEKQKIQFDGRAWKAVWGEHKEAITTIEYLPLGQDINHWKELVTSQFFPGLAEVSAKEFANRFLADLKKTGVLYKSHFIETKPELVIFEFQVQEPKNLQQDELQKIVKTPEGIYVLHYAIKKTNMTSANRKKWIIYLKQSGFITSSKQ